MLNPEHNEDHIMSTKTKKTVKPTNVIKARNIKRTERKHFALGLGVIAFCGTAIVAGTKALYDVASEVV